MGSFSIHNYFTVTKSSVYIIKKIVLQLERKDATSYFTEDLLLQSLRDVSWCCSVVFLFFRFFNEKSTFVERPPKFTAVVELLSCGECVHFKHKQLSASK